MLPLLIPLVAAGASLAWEKIRQARGIPDPDATSPDAPMLPHQWGPGQAPGKPWKADRDLPNASDCGWHGENGDAHLARWMNHSKGIPLPGDIQTWSAPKVATYLAGFFAQGFTHLGDPREILAAMEVDAKLYGCLSQKLIAGIAKAPGKVGAWISQSARAAGDTVSDAASEVQVKAGGGEASVSVGGTSVGVKW